ncbi:MAG: hypothetical protein QMC90_03765 [Dehalococcoidales bacterium]|nr:hypothetical protein [Dehalococcoidales bacterium]
MQIYGISEREMTPAERFEEFLRRIGLRNRLSNALMAICLYEVGSKSKNLTKYVTDGLGISKECFSTLEEIAQNYLTSYQYSNYTSKLLLDILTSGLKGDPDKTKLERYKKGFLAAQRVLETIQQEGKPDEEMVREAEQTIAEVDKEIESTYATEEGLYHGFFIPRSI